MEMLNVVSKQSALRVAVDTFNLLEPEFYI